MTKTAAQRQAAYRARRAHAGPDGNGERHLSVWIDTSTWLALARLARRYAVTKRSMIERLVLAQEERILAAIEPDSPLWRAYFDDKPLRRNDADHGREHDVSMTPT
jgi:hypothetical protein